MRIIRLRRKWLDGRVGFIPMIITESAISNVPNYTLSKFRMPKGVLKRCGVLGRML
jgi:hypothetical protein